MTDHSLGQRSRSSKRSNSAIIGCIVAGIGIGLASTQVAHGQDLVPAPPVDVDPDDPVPGVDALPRKKDDNVLRANAPPPASVFGTEIPRLLGSTPENPFAKAVRSDGQAPAPPSDVSAVDNTFDALHEKAYVCHIDGKFDQALQYYNRAIDCNPGSVEAHFNRGAVLMSLRRYAEALNDLDFVIQQKSDSSQLYATRAYARCELVKPNSGEAAFKPALADITRALELSPDEPFARCVRGMIAVRTGDYDPAITNLSWAIEHECNQGEARYYRGCSFAMKGETDKAITDFTEALKQYPKSDDIYTRRAKLYTEKNDFNRAQADFDQVVRLRPDDAMVYLQRMVFFLFKGDNGRAMADIERVVRLEPKAGFAHFVHALMLYFIESQSDRALAALDKAIRLEPGVIVYPAFRCFLNGKKSKYRPAFKDLALCTAILLQSRIKTLVGADLKQNRFGVAVDLKYDRRDLSFLARIDFSERRFFVGMGLNDDSDDLQHNDQASKIDQQLINQNVLNLLVAKFVGASD